MVMLTNVRFPNSPFIEQATGRPAREWVLWLQAPQLLALTLNSPLQPPSGGTGQSTYVVGDLLYASGTATLSRLADVATGNALISGGVGVAPLWGKIGLTTHVSGTLAVGNGGSGATSLTGYLKGNGTSPFTAVATIPNTDITGLGTISTKNTGASGSFTAQSGEVVTVTDGIITSIV